MLTTSKNALWTTFITLAMTAPALAQHLQYGGSTCQNRPQPIQTVHRHGHPQTVYVDPYSAHSSHMISQFDDQFLGTYCERNGNCYFQSAPSAQFVQVQFGSFSHVDDLAARLEFLSNELCLDLYYNYSHNYGFEETYAEAYQIFEAARFIHSLEHQHQDRDAIRSRLNGLDALFHHVQGDVRGWSRQHRRQVGNLGIITKLDLMEASLHHLMNDVGVSDDGGFEQAPAPVGQQLAPPPGTAALFQ